MRRTLRYFAYGSNLHPERLRRRTGWCRIVGLAELTGYRLAFHKRGMDGSGKCNALYTGAAGDSVRGVVYELHAHQKPRLDRAEGRGEGYRQVTVRPRTQQRRESVFTYLAYDHSIDDSLNPFDWYVALVAEGMRYHRLGSGCLQTLAQVRTVTDPDSARGQGNFALLAAVLRYRDRPRRTERPLRRAVSTSKEEDLWRMKR